MEIRNILVPTDFSIEADNALKFAHDLAKNTECIVDLFNVVKEPRVPEQNHESGQNWTKLVSDLKEQSWKRLDEIAVHKKFDDTCIRINQLTVESGNQLNEAVSKAARENNTELIITGTKGTLFHDFDQASNSSSFVHVAPCPVLAVKNYDSDTAISRIIFTSNFLAENDASFDVVAKLAKFYDAEIYLVDILDSSNYHEDKHADNMQRLALNWELENYQIILHESTNFYEGFMEVIADIPSELIAIGYPNDKDTYYRETAELLTNQSTVPILSIPFK